MNTCTHCRKQTDEPPGHYGVTVCEDCAASIHEHILTLKPNPKRDAKRYRLALIELRMQILSRTEILGVNAVKDLNGFIDHILNGGSI